MLPVYDIPMRDRIADYLIAKAFVLPKRHIEDIPTFRKRFVRLPREIRDMIYDGIVVESNPIGTDADHKFHSFFPFETNFDYSELPNAMYDWRHGCRIYEEIRIAYYTKNTFEFYRAGVLIRWIKSIHKDGPALIRNLKLSLRIGDPAKAFRMLVKKCPNIRNLEFNLEEHWRFGRNDVECYRSSMKNAHQFFFGTHQEIVFGPVQNLGTTELRTSNPAKAMRYYYKDLAEHLIKFKAWLNKWQEQIAKKKRKAAWAEKNKHRVFSKKKRPLENEEEPAAKKLKQAADCQAVIPSHRSKVIYTDCFPSLCSTDRRSGLVDDSPMLPTSPYFLLQPFSS